MVIGGGFTILILGLLFGLLLVGFFLRYFFCYIIIKPGYCRVYFNGLLKVYTCYQAGLHHLRLIDWFFSVPIVNKVQDTVTKDIPLVIYPDKIVKYPILTDSKLNIEIDCVAYIRITDPQLAVTAITDLDNFVDSTCKSQLRNSFSSLSMDQIVKNQGLIEQSLLVSINQDLAKNGVSCVGFCLIKVKLPPQIQQSVASVTSQQLIQKCEIIKSQTKQMLQNIELKLLVAKEQELLKIADLGFQSKLSQKIKQIDQFRKVDPSFKVIDYLNLEAKRPMYDKCSNIILYEQLDKAIGIKQLDKLVKPNNDNR